MKYVFGDIVIVNGNLIGVIVKSWITKKGVEHEVYIRNSRIIEPFLEKNIVRYMVRHKVLSDEEQEWQQNAENA